MVNAWSLAYSILNGTFDEDYPIMTDDNRITPQESDEYDPIEGGSASSQTTADLGNGITISGLQDGVAVANISDDYDHSDFWYDYTRNDPHAVNPFTDLNTEDPTEENMASDGRYKYHEDEILKDIKEYVSGTYNGHYTGTKFEFRNVQTLDLMASRDLASDFCQANILKYGSRYGSKDGKNRKDLMKVIHYAMLLLHFDGHYGKPSMSTGNIDEIDHNMP